MRDPGILALILLFSFPALADMSAAERCEKEGDVAKEASNLRISGVDKDTATNSLIEIHEQSATGLSANTIRGLVMVSYMAKMKPDKMRDYAIDQCRKNILK